MKAKVLAMIVLGFTSVANADKESVAKGQLRVHVKVARTCYVQDSDLNFGTIDGLFRSDVNASTNIVIRCTADAPFEIGLDEGKGFDNGSRRMVDDEGKNFIAYKLFKPDNATEWDKDNRVSATATGLDQSFAVYGTIPAKQEAIPGDRNYNDYVTIDLYMASAP